MSISVSPDQRSRSVSSGQRLRWTSSFTDEDGVTQAEGRDGTKD